MSVSAIVLRVAGIALLTTTGVLLARLGARLVHRIWRAGYDAERRLALALSAVRIALALLVVVGAMALVMPWLRYLPNQILLLVLGIVALAGFPLLQNAVAGVYLIGRGDVREGDRVRVADVVGTVREIGLGRVRIREEDGSTTLVPNRVFVRQSVGVLRASGRATIVAQLDVDPQQVPSKLLRQLVLLCPYRVVGTPVRVRQVGDSWEINLQTWRPRCHEEVERYLRRATRAYVDEQL